MGKIQVLYWGGRPLGANPNRGGEDTAPGLGSDRPHKPGTANPPAPDSPKSSAAGSQASKPAP
jgi:hypothetical protein